MRGRRSAGLPLRSLREAEADAEERCRSTPGTARAAIDDEDILHGRVTRVIDGDTFKVKIQGVAMNFRLADIDAPELDQPYGEEARKALDAAIDGETVVMQKIDQDSRGRFVVHVWLGSVYVNRELVAQGAAWFYSEYARGDCLYEIEQEARDAKRGLWALPLGQRQEPWVWRHTKREAADSSRRKP